MKCPGGTGCCGATTPCRANAVCVYVHHTPRPPCPQGRPERVRAHLLKFRACPLLCRAALAPCPPAAFLALRLVRCQAKFMGLTWRRVSVVIISAVYRFVGTEVGWAQLWLLCVCMFVCMWGRGGRGEGRGWKEMPEGRVGLLSGYQTGCFLLL